MKLKWFGVFLVLVLISSLFLAQGRRGAGGPGGGGTSTIEKITVHSKALEGNLEGDSADREVTIYLPPTYRTDTNRRFPVVYLLPDYGARDDMFTGGTFNFIESADRRAGATGFSIPIIVVPNAYTLHRGSIYSNSATTGDWEAFIARDLVAEIDSKYRTISERISRGLAGYGAGGYGALRIGMKRPDVFSSLYIMSASFLDPADTRPEMAASAEPVKTRAQAEEAARADQARSAGPAGPSLALALAAAWSPNPGNAPLFLELPVKEGKPRTDIAAKWNANAGLTLMESQAANLNKLYSLSIEVGSKDPQLAGNRKLHEAMYRLKVAHFYQEYEGDSKTNLNERFDRNFLPFFSKNLAAPANPTSPAVKD